MAAVETAVIYRGNWHSTSPRSSLLEQREPGEESAPPSIGPSHNLACKCGGYPPRSLSDFRRESFVFNNSDFFSLNIQLFVFNDLHDLDRVSPTNS